MNAKQQNKSHSQGSKVLRSGAKMAVATFSSRILGLVREQAMAAVFGASFITDAFGVAYRIPNVLRDLFAEGVFSSAFVPIFTEAKGESEKRAKGLLWSLFLLLGGLTLILSSLMIIFAPSLVELFTNEAFSNDPERFHLAVDLLRIMAPFLVVVSIAALFMGSLNSLKVFFIPALAPASFNLAMIFSILVLPGVVSKWGMNGALALGIGVMAGGFLQMLVQLPLLIKKGYGPTGPIQLFNKDTKRIIHRVGIGTIGVAATQINILVTTILATGTVVGAVSWLNYAFRLFQFPVGILSVSIAGSNLVHFSDSWKKGDKQAAVGLLKESYLLSFVTIAPAFALLFAMRDESVYLIFERGAFSSHDTSMTSLALKYYLYGLPFYGLYKIFAPTFFTIDRPKVPVQISAFSILVNIIFCVVLVPKYGFQVLALGTTLSMVLNSFLQGLFLKKYLELPMKFFIDGKVIKFFLAGGICYCTAEFLANKFIPVGMGFMATAIPFVLVGLGGAASYFISLLLLGESKFSRKMLRR